MAGTEGDSSTTLDEFVGTAFGDITDESEPGPEDTTGEAAGAPPAELPTSPDEAPPPEGTDKAERTGEPPKAAAQEAPDKSGAEPDLLKDAKPATYTVNGQERTYEGLRVLGEDGAIIGKDDLPDLLRRLGERDHLYETNQTLYENQKTLERLSEWKVRGEDGKEQVLQGRAGLEALRVENAQKDASLSALVSIFQRDQSGNYPNFSKLVSVTEGPNGQLLIVPDPDFLNSLIARSNDAEQIAGFRVREELGKLSTAPQPSQSTSQPDYSAQAPQIIEAAAKSLGLDSKVLTDRDKGFLAAQFPRYIRTATEQDQRQNPTDSRYKVGSPIVDASFTQVVKDRVEMRKEASASVTANVRATTENNARLAAAARGKPTAKTTPQKRTTEPNERATDADKGFDMLSNLTSRRAG